MDEMRKIVWVFVVWDVREKERERDEISSKKKRMKKNYLNRIKCRIDREYEGNS